MNGAQQAEPAIDINRVPGEGRGEAVFTGRRGPFSYYVTHEYETAPWAWIIVEGGDDLIAFSDAPTHREALIDLAAELDRLDPPKMTPAPAGGLVGAIGRLLWGE